MKSEPPMLEKSQCLLLAGAAVSVRAKEGRVPATWRFQFAVVVPTPRKLFVPRKSVDVPTAVFTPLKYGIWPIVPESEALPLPEIQEPLMAKQPPVRLKPTFEVLVAEPAMFRPERVVV